MQASPVPIAIGRSYYPHPEQGSARFRGGVKAEAGLKKTKRAGPSASNHNTTFYYRLKQANAFRNMSGSTDLVAQNNTFASASDNDDYREWYKYDPNGNILNLSRHGISMRSCLSRSRMGERERIL